MSEYSKPSEELQVVFSDQVKSDVGIEIIKFDVLFKNKPYTIYSTPGFTEIGLASQVREIEKAAFYAEHPRTTQDLTRQRTNVEETVQVYSEQYIEDLRNTRYSLEVHESALFPLVKQKAYKKLFDRAKKL